MNPHIRISLIVYSRKSKAKATPIYILISQTVEGKQRKKKVNSGLNIDSLYHWNQKRQMIVKSAPNSQEKNEFLRKYLLKMESLRMKLELEHDYVTIDMLLDAMNPKQHSHSLIEDSALCKNR